MSSAATSGFGELLRRHRMAIGLTQEALAERAGLSVNGIQKLERGATRPYRDTTRRLVAALGLADGEQEGFLAAAAPAPRAARRTASPTSTAPKDNLPAALSSFVGREREIAEVRERLGSARLVSLTGAGGCGKTRLALEVAAALRGRFPDGVWLVEFASLTDPALVPATLAASLGIPEAPRQPFARALAAALRSRRLLLVLDNCEHLVDACARLTDTLLRDCPDLRVLATSREALGIGGEVVYRVPSLAFPDPQDSTDMAPLATCESVRLLCERARLVRPEFVPGEGNAVAVAEICWRLDGIPLAIELAAARLRVLSVEQLATGLSDCFRLLTGGSRTAPRRHQTLRATIDWSYALLSDAERAVLRRLAVFASGCTLPAAEAVCAGDGVAIGDVLDLLTSLADKSLLITEAEAGEARFRPLVTIRQYAEEQLVAAGEIDAIRLRHRDWYLAWAERSYPALVGPDQGSWYRRFDAERDNLRAALDRSRAAGDADAELRLAAALGRFWRVHGPLSEGRTRLAEALARAGAAATPSRATALNWLGQFESMYGNHRHAIALLEESLALARPLGDLRLLVLVLRHLAAAFYMGGQHRPARPLLDEALTLARRGGLAREASFVLRFLAFWPLAAGDLVGARQPLEEAMALARETRDGVAGDAAAGTLGEVALRQGRYDEARRLAEEALAMDRAIGHREGEVAARILLGDIALRQGDRRTALAHYREALRDSRQRGDTPGAVYFLERQAILAEALGRPRRAARFFGAVEAGRETSEPMFALPDTLVWSEQAVASARQALGEEAFAAAWAEGRALTLDEVLADGLREDEMGG